MSGKPKLSQKEQKDLVDLVKIQVFLSACGEMQGPLNNLEIAEIFDICYDTAVDTIKKNSLDLYLYRKFQIKSNAVEKNWRDGCYDTPEYRKTLSDNKKRHWKEKRQDILNSLNSPENILRASKHMKAYWENNRDTLIQILNTPDSIERNRNNKKRHWKEKRQDILNSLNTLKSKMKKSESIKKIWEEGKMETPKAKEAWKRSGQLNGAKNSEKNTIYEFKGIKYHSMEEAAIANLFEKYIPNYKIEKGKTWQVNGSISKSIDFLVNNEFVEYHPILLFFGKARGDFKTFEEYQKYKQELEQKQDKKEYQNQIKFLLALRYVQSRLEAITESDYKGTLLIFCSSAEEVYNQVIKKHSNVSKEQYLQEFKQLKKEVKELNKGLKKAAYTSSTKDLKVPLTEAVIEL
ncbi:MAG: hypothetical protein WC413_04235 [Candidatus Nanoarchaeia archaeon]